MNMFQLITAQEMKTGDAAVTALFGYCVVFTGLVILMALLYCTGHHFKKKAAKEKASSVEKTAEIPEKTTPEPIPEPVAEKKTAPGSAGHVKLYDVPDKEAAMIMAIVADTMKKPVNELHFISIKEVK